MGKKKEELERRIRRLESDATARQMVLDDTRSERNRYELENMDLKRDLKQVREQLQETTWENLRLKDMMQLAIEKLMPADSVISKKGGPSFIGGDRVDGGPGARL